MDERGDAQFVSVGIHAKKQRTKDYLVSSVESMTECTGVITNSMKLPSELGGRSIEQEAMIANTVKREVTILRYKVNESIEYTKRMISGLSDTLKNFVGKLNGGAPSKNGV